MTVLDWPDPNLLQNLSDICKEEDEKHFAVKVNLGFINTTSAVLKANHQTTTQWGRN